MSARWSTSLRLFDLFGRHVVWRAHDILGAGQGEVALLPEDLGDAEIRDLHPAAFIQQDVLRLDVAVHDALLVRELQRLADLRHDLQRLHGVICLARSNCRRFTPSTNSIRK